MLWLRAAGRRKLAGHTGAGIKWRCADRALFMDTHTMGGPVGLDDVAKAHAADLQTQDAHGVHYLRYWVDQEHGKIFCLVDAPDADSAAQVHREAHGLVADEIYPVAEGA